ncbi:dihydroxyacetone kinase phosphoryl donor subunit DhaM [Actinotalea solisilvae]|uniref:dihydroxyacetone kinase phosphoryl donor subunit DhaM n=1 Tax=Actinotalea solisilvae TaxID=2072922 RepID=UPI0018F12D1B|nr:dihydroxyacetone kinase phosphoryl donor subunit DhaM [Actinotalea solisilvae]
MTRVALVLVSHSALVARGTAELAAQMAPDVRLVPAGGLPVGGGEEIGTSLDRVLEAVTGALADGDVVVLTDLGSAVLTSETALEMLDDDDAARVRLPDAPFVEGAVAAAVAAQQGGDADAVARAAEGAAGRAADAPPSPASAPGVTAPPAADGPGDAGGPAVRRTAVVRNPLGLHARPAALLARHVAGTGVPVRVQGVDGASVLALMALGSTAGDELTVEASGPDAEQAVASVVELIEGGFGEAG